MKLTFLGATHTVTGSKYLLEYESKKILIDCGLFQGYKKLRLQNWDPLPVSPGAIDAVILTHAHIDHSGYIPLLVKHGFKGPIYCAPATKDLCTILLPDSGHIQEEDARRANKYKYTKHQKALPLYTERDARDTFKQFVPCPFGVPVDIEGVRVTFHRAGHILGSASVEVRNDQTSILFSGDVGRPHDPILKAPEQRPKTDYLVLESTYGDRLHHTDDPMNTLESIIHKTINKGGSVLLPAFAVGRAQSLLFFLYKLKSEKRIPHNLPIYLDSPMAINASRIMNKYRKELHISGHDCEETCGAAYYVSSAQESKQLNVLETPKIIISASGMATGGRVLHHLKQMLPVEKNTVVFAGFQAGGTRGARLVNGETELKMFGEMVPVKANIEMVSNLSAHADYEELLGWVSQLNVAPRKVFITHGEAQASEALEDKIKKRLGWSTHIPDYMECVQL